MAGTSVTADVTIFNKYTRTFNWTISKSVTPVTWNLCTGDSGTSQYSIIVTKSEGVDELIIYGQVCVTNVGDVPTEGLTITEDLAVNSGGGFDPILSDLPVDVTQKPNLDPGETYCYDYSINVPNTNNNIRPGGTYKVTANVTISNHGGNPPGPHTISTSNTTIIPTNPTLVHNSITVTDTNGETFSATATTTLTYTKTFTCDSDQGIHNNIATIHYDDDGDGPSASASVTVNCKSCTCRGCHLYDDI